MQNKYIIKTHILGVPYYAQFKKSQLEVRGLVDHATSFVDRDSAEFWKRRAQEQRTDLKFEVCNLNPQTA